MRFRRSDHVSIMIWHHNGTNPYKSRCPYIFISLHARSMVVVTQQIIEIGWVGSDSAIRPEHWTDRLDNVGSPRPGLGVCRGLGSGSTWPRHPAVECGYVKEAAARGSPEKTTTTLPSYMHTSAKLSQVILISILASWLPFPFWQVGERKVFVFILLDSYFFW